MINHDGLLSNVLYTRTFIFIKNNIFYEDNYRNFNHIK